MKFEIERDHIMIDGVRVNVADDATCERADYVVCSRVIDAIGERRVANSRQVLCAAGCFHLIWVAPSSPLKPPKVCVQCATSIATARKQ